MLQQIENLCVPFHIKMKVATKTRSKVKEKLQKSIEKKKANQDFIREKRREEQIRYRNKLKVERREKYEANLKKDAERQKRYRQKKQKECKKDAILYEEMKKKERDRKRKQTLKKKKELEVVESRTIMSDTLCSASGYRSPKTDVNELESGNDTEIHFSSEEVSELVKKPKSRTTKWRQHRSAQKRRQLREADTKRKINSRACKHGKKPKCKLKIDLFNSRIRKTAREFTTSTDVAKAVSDTEDNERVGDNSLASEENHTSTWQDDLEDNNDGINLIPDEDQDDIACKSDGINSNADNKMDANDSIGKQDENEENYHRSSIWKNMKKVLHVLPKTPHKKAKIIKALVHHSPNTESKLSTDMKTNDDIKRGLMFDSLVDSMKSKVSETKPRTKGQIKSRNMVYEVLKSVAVGKKSKKYRVSLRLKKLTGFNKSVKIKKVAPWVEKCRKKRRDAIQPYVIEMVHNFYRSEAISRILPNKKDVTLDEHGLPTYTYVMCVTKQEAYEQFTEQHAIKIGKRTFDKLKPKQVKPINLKSRICCLCIICQNVSLKCQVFKEFTNGINRICVNSSGPEKESIEHIIKKMSSGEIPKDKKNIVGSIVCPFVDEVSPDCVKGKCSNCGVNTSPKPRNK